MALNMEQEVAERIATNYNIDESTALDIVQDVIDLYELKDEEFSDMFVRLIRDYNRIFGMTDTYLLIIRHLDVDEDEAKRIYERII